MAKIEIACDFIKISENNIVFYQDNLENFKKDCVILNIEIPPFPEVVVFFTEPVFFAPQKYVIDKGNQSGLPVELDDFCKLCLLKKDDFVKTKAQREKIPEPSLEEKKQQARQTINSLCFTARLKVSGTTDTNKTASWAVYKDIALRYKVNQITQIEKTCLENEVALRKIPGENLESFVDKILQNAELFFKATTLIMGSEKRAMLDLETSQNDQDIENAILNLTNILSKL
jgi:hypothetical protein